MIFKEIFELTKKEIINLTAMQGYKIKIGVVD